MKPTAPTAVLFCLCTLIGLTLLSLSYGSTSIPIDEILTALISSDQPDLSPLTRDIIWELRLPRVCAAILVGAALSASGAALQGLFRNPLADPYVLGIASGGACGAALILWLAGLIGIATSLAPIGAVIGALIASFSVYGISMRTRGLSLNTILLAGVAVGLVFSALLSLVLVLAGEQAGDILGWLLGTMSGQSWSNVTWILVATVPGLIALLSQSAGLDAFQIGEDAASGVGVNLRRVKLIVLGSTVLLVSGAVAFCGLIGFVGLIIPHAVRRWTGPGHRWSIMASAIGGAALLVGADLLSRVLIPGREVPVGIITGCLGGPFFLVLLMKQVRHA